MNGLASFARKHHLSVRDIADICGGPGKVRGGVSYPTVHRLMHRRVQQSYVERVEPIVVNSLRRYLVLKGYSEPQAAAEVPDKFLDAPTQFTEEITVPTDCSANYVFKDQNGKILSVVVFTSPGVASGR